MNISKSFFTAAFFTTSISSLAFAGDVEPIRIGVMGPITGAQAANGKMMSDAAMAFARYLNEKGGIMGRGLEIKLYDDACEPKQAVSVANAMVSDGISLVVGPFCSGVTKAARDTFKEYNITNITMSQATDITGPDYPMLFRITPSNADLSGKIIETMKETKEKKIAVFHVNDDFGRGLADLIAKGVSQSGLEVLRESFMPGEQDFSAFGTKMSRDKIDTVLIAGGVSDISRVARQLRDNGFKGTIVTPGTGTLPEYAAVTACPGAQGTIAIAADDKTFEPQNAHIVDALKKSGIVARDNILFTWAALDVLGQAIEKAGTAESTMIGQVIRDNRFETPQGLLDFVSDGVLAGNLSNPPTALYTWNCNSGVPVLAKQ